MLQPRLRRKSKYKSNRKSFGFARDAYYAQDDKFFVEVSDGYE